MITVNKASAGKLQQMVRAGRNAITSDVSLELGGDDAGFDPHDLLDSALGACTALTVTMVAQRKNLPLTDVRVEISHEESDSGYQLHRKIELVGNLSEEQRSYLLGIANKCPVHRSLGKKIEIETSLQA